jgi:hypothetical protein
MKERFITKNLSADRRALLEQIIAIIQDYQGQGFTLTLRQLYYQLVTRNLVTNEERSYKRVGELVSDGRLIGEVDWDAIEDRVRQPKVPGQFKDLRALVDAAVAAYRLPRWDGQENYVELWVEKDALAGVLAPIADEYHVTLMVNRGYSSQSAMYESAYRFIAHQDAQRCYLLYLGDHDPSGEDMVRDVGARLRMFGAEVVTEKIALTMDQVQEHNPPPNPAKMTDSRAAKYVDEHGASSWEVDALPPEVLRDLIVERIEELWEPRMMERIKAQEETDKSELIKAASRIVRKRK